MHYRKSRFEKRNGGARGFIGRGGSWRVLIFPHSRHSGCTHLVERFGLGWCSTPAVCEMIDCARRIQRCELENRSTVLQSTCCELLGQINARFLVVFGSTFILDNEDVALPVAARRAGGHLDSSIPSFRSQTLRLVGVP
jgi:hypothetical protein